MSEYQQPVEFSSSPFKLPLVCESKEEAGSGSGLERTLQDSLASDEALVQQIQKDILDAVSSEQTQELVEESREEKMRTRFARLQKLGSRVQGFYRENRKLILLVFFFVLFWKIILLVIWIFI